MFINSYYETKESTMHIWESVDGQPNYRTEYWIPYVFMRTTGGDIKTIDGHTVTKKTFDTYNDYYSFCKDRSNIYENKVRPEIQFLAESYHNIMDDQIDVPRLRICSLDIEVAHEESFPDPESAEFPVVLVTLYDGERSVTFGEKEYSGKKTDVYLHCEDESELLRKLFAYMHKYPAHVLTGWNIYNFDLPYLINRSKKLFGKGSKIYMQMSPINIVRTWEAKKLGRDQMNVDIAGVTILDYYDIYRWYGPNLESYRLDYVAHHELGVGKVDYSEYEDLRKVYKENWDLYVEYNKVDAQRVYQLEEKCGYIKLVQSLSLLTKCPMKYYHTMTQLIEGTLLTHYRRNGLCAPIFFGGDQQTFEAAYVKEPQAGMHEWIVDLDIVSSYPTAIITLNMSTETYFGKIAGFTEDQIMEYTRDREFPDFYCHKDTAGNIHFTGPKRIKFNEALEKGLLTIAPNGSVFTTHEAGTLAAVQRNIFAKRKEVKGMMIDLKKQLAEKKDKDMEEKANQYFDLQWALKILLNAMFGVTAVPYSRYFNTNIAEAITSCGRATIKAGEKYVNRFLQNDWILDKDFMVTLYGTYDEDFDENMIEHTEDEDWVAYMDTDSVFIRMGEFLNRVVSDKSKWQDLDDHAKIDKVIKLSQCIEKIVNEKCFVDMQKGAYNSPVDDFTILFKQEIVAKTAIFVKKKKYAYWAVNEEGAPCDKISVTGLEMVRSDSAEAVRIMLKEVVDMILKGVSDKEISKKIDDCRSQLKGVYPEEIAANVGINKLDKYLTKDGWRKRAPWHVKGVYNYRRLLKDLGIENEYEDINNGTKARVIYVKPNPYGMVTISFLRWPKEFDSVIQPDYEVMIEKFFLKKIKTLLEPMNKEELLDGAAKERLSIFFEGLENDVS